MGCDIHLYVETRGKDGAWEWPYTTEKEYGWIANTPNEGIPDYWGRNYGLFAILADVRNGWGVAGFDTGDSTTPISEPRGVPENASQGYVDTVAQWDCGGHSHSYFTLEELLRHDWSVENTVHRSWVRRRENHLVGDEYLDPDSYAERVREVIESPYGGYNVAVVHWGAQFCSYPAEEQGPSGWRTIEWTESHMKTAGTAWAYFMVDLASLAVREGLWPDQVRIVFFFDN